MKRFSVNLSSYKAPTIDYDATSDDGDVLSVTWEHRCNKDALDRPLELVIYNIITDDSGNILQWGSNYGRLEF